MKTMDVAKMTALAVGTAALMAAGSAQADSVTYDLTVLNSDLINAGYSSGPTYVTVTVNRADTTHATITFQATGLDSDIIFGNGMAGVNVNASTFNYLITQGYTPGSVSTGPGNYEDGFGTFNFSINNHDGPNSGNNSSSSVIFTLTDTSGTWADASSVLLANENGAVAAAHVWLTGGPNGNTGFVGNGTPTPPSVPDGASTAMLFGIASLGLGMLKRRFAK